MSPISQPPRFSHQELSRACRDHYHLEGRFKELPSEQDQNALLQTENGEAWVVKVANSRADLAFCHGQQLLLEHLAKRLPWTPRLRLTLQGERFRMVESQEGDRHHLQVLSYLPGRPLAKVPYRDPELWHHLGLVIGRLREALRGFDHPSLHRDFEWELSSGIQTVHNHLEKVKDGGLRSAMETCLNHFQVKVEPRLGSLERGIIHGDLNDYNVLVGEGDCLSQRHRRVSGIIDFGDTVDSLVVADLAVAAAYAVLDESNPLATVAALVRGYGEATSIQEEEIHALFGLIRLRLCISAAMAAHQRSQQPENEYLGISQAPIARTLPWLAEIHPQVAEAIFREAAGLEPVRDSERLRRWMEDRQGTFSPVLEGDLGKVKVLDLSIGSPLLHGSPSENAEKKLSSRLFGLLEETGAEVGVGRYDEVRYFYTSEIFGDATSPLTPRRVVHLGLDLFAPAGRRVLAPLSGRVFAFGRNESPLDYGPLIILEHEADGRPFWTLYGHLSLESLEGLVEGQVIAEGEAFAALGEATVNGGWPPHLHFQVMVDHLEKGLDFPGVASADQRKVWTSFSPDPRFLLGLDQTLFPDPEPSLEKTQEDRNRRIAPSVSLSYRRPVKVVRGFMQYLFDHEGRRFLDAYNNVPHVGHCHPQIQKAIRDQMAVLNTNTRYLHDGLQSYARELTQHLPESLDTCFFVNSGSEANELALRLARNYTGRKSIIVLEAAYHGHTTTLIDISPYKHEGPGGEGRPPWVHVAPLPDLYRGVFRGDDPESRARYVKAVDQLLQGLQNQGEAPSAFICESFPSVGGQVPLPEGYLKGVYRSVRAAGGLCIADEVQTGFGRIGTHFWAFDSQEVVPDVVVLGKPMGNGHPLGAVITTREIAQAFDNGMEFFSTFGGNTVSCAVGRAVLRVVEEEKLQEHARVVGEKLLEGLRPLVEESLWVGDVRGSGLFLGVELVKDPESRVPAPEEASYVVNRLRQEGILLGTDGPEHNVIKIRPPMPFSLDDADLLLETLRRVLEELA